MNITQISTFLFLLVCSCAVNAQLSMKKTEGGITIVDGPQNVLHYQTSLKSKDGKFERCNYIHPLWSIDGNVITEDFPPDHLHHRGVFWAWHQVWIGDKRISDAWELVNFEQEVVELEFVKVANEAVQIKTEVEWKSDKWKKEGHKIPYLNEKTKITVHPITGKYRKIDFEISLLALEEGVEIGGSEDEKGYGGFAIRMALPSDVLFAGLQGILEPEETAITSDGFVNISGSIGANKSKGGVVMVDNNENPGYPQSWILRAKNSMQNVVYPGREAVGVSTSKPLVLNYSLLLYSGKLSDKRINKTCDC